MRRHGGNIHEASKATGIPEADILDFSASINSLGVPRSVLREIRRSAGLVCRYPEPFSETLSHFIAQRLGIDPSSVVCGNGSTELIYLITRSINPGRVLIPSPAFSEYENACRSCGGVGITRFALKKEEDFELAVPEFIASMEGHNLAFLCNPNNPTGTLLQRTDVIKLAQAARKMNCITIIDEAFIDFIPNESVICEVSKNPCLIVLRSLTKFYALPGLRIGYAVLPAEIAENVARHREPWSVNYLAQKAAISALHDDLYAKETFRRMEKAKSVMEENMIRLGIEYFTSKANFYLIRHSRAKELVEALRRRGILVRDCSNFAGLDDSYIRIAVRTERENARLFREMEKILSGFSRTLPADPKDSPG